MMQVDDFSFSISWQLVVIHGKMTETQKDRLNSHLFGKEGIIIPENNNTDVLNFDNYL